MPREVLKDDRGKKKSIFIWYQLCYDVYDGAVSRKRSSSSTTRKFPITISSPRCVEHEFLYIYSSHGLVYETVNLWY